MSVIDTLITDRTEADVMRVEELNKKGFAQMTDAELAEWLSDLKGSYNAADLNRVTQALEYLRERLQMYGNAVNYSPILIEHPVKRHLPNGYEELKYVQSGGTQYIDTGFKPNGNTHIVVTFSMTDTTADYAIFGCRDSASSNMYMLLNRGNTFRPSYGTSIGSFTQFVDDATQEIIAEQDKGLTTINGTSSSATATTFQCSYSLLLCAAHNAASAAWAAKMRLYACQIYDNGEAVRDYFPCISPDGVVGLYDFVTGSFYGNAGSGDFTAGPEISAPVEEELDPYTWYEIDIPTYEQMEQYRQNIAALRDVIAVMAATPEVPESMENLDYIGANNIEQILIDLDFLISNMEEAWFFAGEVYAGEV